MLHIIRALGAVAFFSIAVGSAWAQSPESQVLRSLEFKTGEIELGDGLAKLQTGVNFVYLAPAQAERFLTEVWHNPKGAAQDTFGVVLPRDVNPLSAEGWAIVVSYEKTGYINDKDASEIDYDGLLKDMQRAARDANPERVKQGHPTLDVIGWARPPVYDAKTHTLYWAKQLHFGGADHDTLNYNLRVLGRQGVLILNVVAGMEGLPQIERQLDTVLALFEFKDGQRYNQFDPKIDEVAAIGLAGLIAGGILTKTGFFKGLLIALLASKKLLGGLIVAGVAGAWVAVKRRFRPK